MNADGKVLARYGQRDASSPDSLQSLKGLHYTMKSVLEMHAREKDKQDFAPRTQEHSITINEINGRNRRCYHCHNVREVLNRGLVEAGKWNRDKAYRFPPTEKVGLTLETDRGNIIARTRENSAAARTGLQEGDVLRLLNKVPVHSIADALFALEIAPPTGEIEASWTRDGKPMTGRIELPSGWRRSDVSWRPSMKRMIPSVPFKGTELTASEKQALGLKPDQFALRLRSQARRQSGGAEVQVGDVLIGLDKKEPPPQGESLQDYIRREYLVGDRLELTLLREGKRLTVPIVLSR